MTSARPFQVDLRGVIDLLSRHIYSSPRVFVRELLQNGRDAIAARRSSDPDSPAGRITVRVDGPEVSFTDNGIGLTATEATDLLATVGRSSKRDEVFGLRREEFLGQFGIGLLSCFLVADDIVVVSQSSSGAPAIRWVGSSDGTFRIEETDEERLVGTTVTIRVRGDDARYADPDELARLLRLFGEFLPDDILLDAGSRIAITREAPFLSDDLDAAIEYGSQLIGSEPLGMIPVDVPGTGTRGVAYVLPFSPPPNGRQSHRVYLGRMLLAERVPDLLPDWAFFVRCVVTTDGLSPTASRETLVENDALISTREALGVALREWIVDLATNDPRGFAVFVAVHQLALKSMAIHDDDLARALLPHIVMETSSGSISLGELLAESDGVRYAETVDEFRQIAPVVRPGRVVVNAGYTMDVALLRRIPVVFPGASSRAVGVMDVLAELADVAGDEAAEFARRASAGLGGVDVDVRVKAFEPVDLPALYVADPAVLRRFERGKARDMASAMWASVLDQVDDIVTQQRGGSLRPTVCFNWENALVGELAATGDDVVFDRSVRLLYVQSLLAGHHPLRSSERAMLTSAMSDLIQLSLFRPTTAD